MQQPAVSRSFAVSLISFFCLTLLFGSVQLAWIDNNELRFWQWFPTRPEPQVYSELGSVRPQLLAVLPESDAVSLAADKQVHVLSWPGGKFVPSSIFPVPLQRASLSHNPSVRPLVTAAHPYLPIIVSGCDRGFLHTWY